MHDTIDQSKAISVSFGIIFAILAFLVPSAIYFPLKSGLVTEAIEYGMSHWGMINGGIGLLALSVILFILPTGKNKKFKLISSIIFLSIAIIGNALSIKDYYYFTDQHFVFNGPFTVIEKTYDWNDFKSIEERVSKIEGTLTVETVIFRMKDGTELQFETGAIMKMYDNMIYKVTGAGGEHIRTDLPN